MPARELAEPVGFQSPTGPGTSVVHMNRTFSVQLGLIVQEFS